MRADTDRRKVVILGTGAVGATTAYAALVRGVCDDVVLIDANASKARAEVEDLNHGLSFVPAARVRVGELADAANARVIVITAGAKQKPGQSRLDLAAANVAMLRQVVPQLCAAAPEAILLLVTNPVDVLTYAAWKISGWPAARVFGSGTVLDSSRFRFLIAERLGLAVSNIHAYIVGEHGDSEVPLWSSAQAGQAPVVGLALDGHPTLGPSDQADIFAGVRDAAQRIIAAKGATNWAIGLATARILEAILRDERAILPVSRLLSGQFGISDVCLSLPSVVGAAGVGAIVPLDPTEAEQAALRRSAQVVKETLAKVFQER